MTETTTETVEKRLKEFTEYFIDEFETRIEFYRKILEEKSDSKDGNSSVISGSKQAISGGVSFATGIPFLGPLVGAIYEQGGKKIVNTIEDKRGKKEADSLYDLIYNFKEEKLTYKKMLIEVCFEIFYSFEKQFISVTSLKGGETRAMLKLAKTCVTKILDFFVNNDVKICAKSIFEAVIIIEESVYKKYVSNFKMGRTVYEKNTNNKMNSLNLITKCGLYISNPDSSNYYSKMDLDPDNFGFRRPTSYENDLDLEKTYFKVENPKEDSQYILNLNQKEIFVKQIFEKLSKRDPKLMEDRFKTTLDSLQNEILSQINQLKNTESSTLDTLKITLKNLETQVLNEICLYYVKGKTLFDFAEKDRHNKHNEAISILGQTNSSLVKIDSSLQDTLTKVTYIHNHVVTQENKPIIFNLTPPKNFIGRENELNELQEGVSKHKILVLNGQRGIGKTEIVRKFVQNKKLESNNNIIWLNCDTNEVLIQNFKDLAMLLDFNMAAKTNLSLIEEVFNYFKEKSTIFVFDHCKTSTLFVQNLYDLVPIGEHTSIILVSSNKNWNESYHVITLPKWPPHEASDYVKQILTNQILNETTFSDEDCLKLAEFHDFLPYSLSHATSFIVQLNSIDKKPFTIDDYIKKYGETDISEPIFETPSNDNNDSDDDDPIEKQIFKKIEAESKRFEKRVSREASRIGDQISDGAAHVEEQVRHFFKKLF